MATDQTAEGSRKATIGKRVNEAGARRKAGSGGTIRGAELRTAALFIAPGFLLYAVFMLFPFIQSIYYSFTDWNGATVNMPFVGLANYIDMFKDPFLWSAGWHTVVWIVVGTSVPVAIGLLLALLLWSNTKFVVFFRTLYFIPFVIPVIVTGIVWGWIYHPLFGILNSMLEFVGLDSLTRGWLGDPNTALVAVIVAAIWGSFGFVTVVLFAGLQGVDRGIVEAAEVDGASWLQRSRYVIIPMIAPVLTLVTAITLIGGFAVVDYIIIMTQGGPGTASEVLGSYAYSKAFEQNSVGYGATLSILITVLSLVAAVAFLRFRERER
ncbi:MAG: sugar ABC transporter permease [Actinobacteria bacterium]|nr:sugar ABC transporter permease [Actinomycetota bacterium]